MFRIYLIENFSKLYVKTWRKTYTGSLIIDSTTMNPNDALKISNRDETIKLIEGLQEFTKNLLYLEVI